MLTPLTPQEQFIDQSLLSNWTALKDGLYSLLAALLLLVIAVVSVLHSLLRVVAAGLGLLLWACGLFIVWLYWLRSLAVSRSSSSLLFGLSQFHHDGIGDSSK